MTVVLTERLVLTPVTVADAEDLVLLHGDPNVAHWYDGAWTREQARSWADAMARRWADEGVGKWTARLRHDGTLVGRGGLTRVRLEQEDRLELGWTLRDAARGRGYATEIGRAGLDVAVGRLGAERVVAYTEVHNRASRAVMERLGMELTRVIFRPGLIEGRTGVHEGAPFALHTYDTAPVPRTGARRGASGPRAG